MGIFSFFSAPDDDNVEGSYCDTKGKAHIEYHQGDDIDDAISSAENRGDSVEFGDEDFDDRAVSNRHDEEGRSVVSGPKKPWWR